LLLELIKAAAEHYDQGDGWDMMFGEGTSSEEVLCDPVGAMQSAVALMDSMTV
jgi:hypothetical protein